MKMIEKRKDGSIRVYTQNDEPDMCQQSFKDECDINNIVKRYIDVTGKEPNVPLDGVINDFTGIGNMSLDEIQNAMIEKKMAYDGLPPKLKKRFNGDIVKMMAFINDPDNHAECVALGLYENKKSESKPIKDDSNDVKKAPDEPKK